ncbi:K(+)-transporting ATPase subunit F [Legionella fallonii]
MIFYIVCGIVTVLLGGYLLTVLFKPEWF